MISIIMLQNPEGTEGNINVRGLIPEGIRMREYLELAEGRWFEPGRREVVVGQAIADRYPQARLGGTLDFGRGRWDIVGVMDGGRAAANSANGAVSQSPPS